jgi:hypothetical protein
MGGIYHKSPGVGLKERFIAIVRVLGPERRIVEGVREVRQNSSPKKHGHVLADDVGIDRYVIKL